MPKSLAGKKKARVVYPKKRSAVGSQSESQDKCTECSEGDVQDSCGE